VTFKNGQEADGNQKCTAVTACNLPATATEGKQYIRTAATIDSDNICEREIVCDEKTQDSVAATNSTEARCASKKFVYEKRRRLTQEWYPCQDTTQYMVSGSIDDEKDPPVCGKVIECAEGKEFEVSKPNATNNRVCQTYKTCSTVVGEGEQQEFQSKASTTTSDRQCSNVVPCTDVEYQTASATATENTQCDVLAVCSEAQFVSTTPTVATDRICTDLALCTVETQFISVSATTYSNRQCTTRTACDNSAGFYFSAAPTVEADSTCNTLKACTQTQFESKKPTDLNDRTCDDVKECLEDQYTSQAPTATSDRECTAITKCDDNQFESVPATVSSNRECATKTPTKAPTVLIKADDNFSAGNSAAPAVGSFLAMVALFMVSARF